MVSNVTARRFTELDTFVICHAVLILCSVSLVSTSCKICYKAPSIGSKGTRIKVFCENNAYFDSTLAYIRTPGPEFD